MTTTSVSTVQIMTFPSPLWLAFAACSSIRVSASSWFDRQRVDTFSNDLFIMTDKPIVLMINFSVSSFVTSFARKQKSSRLSSSRHKNDYQFPGIFVVRRTLRRMPFPKKWRGNILFFLIIIIVETLTPFQLILLPRLCRAEDFKEFST